MCKGNPEMKSEAADQQSQETQQTEEASCVINIDGVSVTSQEFQSSSDVVPTIGDHQQTSPPEPISPSSGSSEVSSNAAEEEVASHSDALTTPNLPLPTFSTFVEEAYIPTNLPVLAAHLAYNVDGIFNYYLHMPQNPGLYTQESQDDAIVNAPNIPEQWQILIESAQPPAPTVATDDNAPHDTSPAAHLLSCCGCLLM